MKNLTLTLTQARRFLLAHQGLWPPHSLTGKQGVLDYIRRVGCIQFDPLNIVGHNPELVLQARVADFTPALLQELLYQDRALLDGWDKMRAIYPVEDWPYFGRLRDAARRRFSDDEHPIASVLPQVREALQTRGPLSSIDLDFDRTIDWPWAPARLARAALESMYNWGELIVHHKVHTRKVYDFARHHLPEALLSAPDPNPTEETFHDWYVLRRLGGIGLMWDRSGDAWLGMRGIKSPARKAALRRLLQSGHVLEVQVKNMTRPLYMRRADKPTLARVLEPNGQSRHASILAPLDNLIWDRRFVEALFDFSYVWEVYKPAAERRYGYYVLPILYGDRFVARFEPGRDKESGALVIKQWWWEPDVTTTPEMSSALLRCFRQFMDYLGTGQLQIDDDTAEQTGVNWPAAWVYA